MIKSKQTRFLRWFGLLLAAVTMTLSQPLQAAALSAGITAYTEIMTFTGAVGSFYAQGIALDKDRTEYDLDIYRGFDMSDTIIMAYEEEDEVTVTFPIVFGFSRSSDTVNADLAEGEAPQENNRHFLFYTPYTSDEELVDWDTNLILDTGGYIYTLAELEEKMPGVCSSVLEKSVSVWKNIADDPEAKVVYYSGDAVDTLFRDIVPTYSSVGIGAPVTVMAGGKLLPYDTRVSYQAGYLGFTYTEAKGFTARRSGNQGQHVMVTAPVAEIALTVSPEKELVQAGETIQVTMTGDNYSDMGLEETVLEIYNTYDPQSGHKRLSGRVENLQVNGVDAEFADAGTVDLGRWFTFLKTVPRSMDEDRNQSKSNPPYVVTFDYTVHDDDFNEDGNVIIWGELTAKTPANSFNSWQNNSFCDYLGGLSGGTWIRGRSWDYEKYPEIDFSRYYDDEQDYFYVNSALKYRESLLATDSTLLRVEGRVPEPEPDTYDVHYHANYSGASSPESLTDEAGPYVPGTAVTLKQGSLFSRTGYTFLGWSRTASGPLAYTAEQVAPAVGRPVFQMPEEDVNLYAQWEKIIIPGPEPEPTGAVVYEPNGGARTDGTVTPHRDGELRLESAYTIRHNQGDANLGYQRADHYFLGWNTRPDSSGVWRQEGSAITIDSAAEVVLYAIWVEKGPGDYVVLYDPNCDDFTGSVIDPDNTYREEETVEVLDNGYYYPPGYDFVGWNTLRDGSGIWYDPDDVFNMPPYDVVLYAQWRLSDYRVYYHANCDNYTGAVRDDNIYHIRDEVTVKTNGTKEEPGFVRDGYTFQGWSLTADGPVTYRGDGQETFLMATRDVHLYAIWSKNSTGGGGGGSGSSYNVIYHSEYASGTVTDGTYRTGATVRVKAHSIFADTEGITIELPAGAVFQGWSLENNGYVDYNPQETFAMPGRDVHLYAVYTLPEEEDLLNRDDHYAYVVGYPDGNVRPLSNISREEVTTIFFRLLTDGARDQYWRMENAFPDVIKGRWSNNAISTMENAGIVSGYPDGTFRPGGEITRAEVAAITAQFDSSSYNGADQFSDIGGHWAADYINRASERGWIVGYPDGTFRPDEFITRAEMMTLVNSVLDRNPQSPEDLLPDMVKWPDNAQPSVWYYLQVQEATNSHYYQRYGGGDGKVAGAEYWTSIRPVRDWAAIEHRQ